jgi:RNA polymerase sigma factor (sigma-70 family)
VQDDRHVVAWVAREILPHEAEVRGWLRRSLLARGEEEDVIQEAYCRLSSLDDVAHISNARAYLFQVVRGIVIDQMRRSRVVRIETVTEVDALQVPYDEPSPERIAGARRELAKVRGMIAALPDRCRRIFELRKIEGRSQKEIAVLMGVNEHVVENDVAKGQRLILKAWAEGGAPSEQTITNSKGETRARDRRSDQ